MVTAHSSRWWLWLAVSHLPGEAAAAARAIQALVDGDKAVAVSSNGANDAWHLLDTVRNAVVCQVDDAVGVELLQPIDDILVDGVAIRVPVPRVQVPIHCTAGKGARESCGMVRS